MTKSDDWEGGPIIWLASYPKSGNTWIRMLVSAYASGGRVDINQPKYSISDLEPKFYQAVAAEPLTDLPTMNRLLIRGAALQMMSSMITQSPLTMKTHNANTFVHDVHLIPSCLTRAAIYILRDPRDVALSYTRHFDCSVDDAIEAMANDSNAIGDADEPMRHILGSWSTHVKSWAAKKHPYPVGVVKYEDLLVDPVKRFASLLEYIGTEPDMALVEKSVEAASFDRLQQQEQQDGFRENPRESAFFGHGRAGRWRDELTPEQVDRIEADHGEVMERFGYL